MDIKKKMENVEKTEAEKRHRLIDEMVKAVAPELGSKVEEKEDMTKWMWRPKDVKKDKKKQMKRALKEYLQCFD